MHTLEDLVLFDILSAIRKNLRIKFGNYSEKNGTTTSFEGIPLKIFVSVTTGRRYVCMYMEKKNRFTSFRLDYIKSVVCLDHCNEAEVCKNKLNKNLDKIWGVGFGGRSRNEIVSMKLSINEETEPYIIDRINREGRGGNLERLEANTFLYTKECFDATEMTPWIKTFIGRILALECSNNEVVIRFQRDIASMHKMYCEEE